MFRVYETSIRQLFDFAYIKDAGTRYLGDSQSAPVNQPLNIRIIDKKNINPELEMLNKPGIIVFNLTKHFKTVSGTASEADKKRPDMGNLAVTLSIQSRSKHFNPRLVELNLGDFALDKIIWMYPDFSKVWGNSRSVYGQIVTEDGTPVPWAILHLNVTYQPSRSLTIHAQANSDGDFDVPLNSLPQPAKNISTYNTRLSVLAPPATQISIPDQIMDPDQFVAVNIGIKNKAGTQPGAGVEIDFQPQINLALQADKRTRLLTEDHEQLVIKY